MKIKIPENTHVTFGSLRQGDVFYPICDEAYYCMKMESCLDDNGSVNYVYLDD